MSKSVDSPVWPWRDQVLEAPVRVLGGAEAGDLAHRPEPAAIHRRVGTARERILARQADVLGRRVGDVERRVDALQRQAAERAELRLRAPAARARKRRDLVLLPRVDLRGERARVGRRAIDVVHAVILRSGVARAAASPPCAGRSCARRARASSAATWPSRWRAKRLAQDLLAGEQQPALVDLARGARRSRRSRRARRDGRRSPRAAQRCLRRTGRRSAAPAAASAPLRRDGGPIASIAFRSATVRPRRAGRTC